MRKAFFETITELAQTRADIYLLTGDLGYKLFDDFRGPWPERFFDVGVAESNMVGIASGLSLSGKNVYCYSIIPFLVMRTYEQIRMDIAHHNLNVKLVGVGSGFTYGLEGYSHFGIEDLALMRVLPDIDIVAPADPVEAKLLARASYDHPRPLYVRLGKAGDPIIHSGVPSYEIGKGMVLSEGGDLVILAMGSMVYTALQVRDLLKDNGMNATVVNMHTLRPLDKDLVEDCACRHDAVFTIEDHSIVGGLGSAVAEVLAESAFKGVFKRIGIPEKIDGTIGGSDYLREYYGLDAKGISRTIVDTVK